MDMDTNLPNFKCFSVIMMVIFETHFMKTLSNNENDLKKSVAYKKKRVVLNWMLLRYSYRLQISVIKSSAKVRGNRDKKAKVNFNAGTKLSISKF